MARFIKDRSDVRGLTPGSFVLLGEQHMDKPIIRLMKYDAESLIEKELTSIEEGINGLNEKEVSWLNVYGIHDMDLMKQIADHFELPSLLMDNILNTDQRPKYENGDNYDAFILKMLHFDRQSEQIVAEQIAIVLGKDYVLTMQEKVGDIFDPVRERIRQLKGKVRLNNNDYLVYALIDIIFDNYTILIEDIGSKVEDLEDQLFSLKDVKTVEDIYKFKVELNYLRKSIRPVKDFMMHLLKAEETFIQEKNMQYIRDLNDLVISATDSLELYNNMVSDQLNIYNANVGNRMNEVMKVLTIFASIFIPLSFLAGVFGMNFDFMPELGLKYAYPVFWLVVFLLIGGFLLYFKKKRWI